MIRFIDEYWNRFSALFICQTLNIHREGGFLSLRGYRQSKARGLSARSLRENILVEHIRDVHADNYGVYGVRKMWHALQRQGIDIGREHKARLMRSAGLSGKGKGGAPVTTRQSKGLDLRPDLVNREFKAPGPQSVVGGRHYLCAHQERLHVHSVRDRCVLLEDHRVGVVGFDAHFKPCRCKHSTRRSCAKETTGLIHHLDHG
ncbi:IS3 family transposase [Corynebacterium diphtheriae]|uniref:IS3 family transposase n=1 Tax=Corynebacterium diphtheriae TaxID=1717 RepID=UPI00202BB3D0|nr:IS3 family transposase [Corynebacterium diphtheriae]